jgi:hypothetical protein
VKLLVVAGLLCSGTVAFAASRLGDEAPAPTESSEIRAAEDGTRSVVDERVRAHLREHLRNG